MKTCKKLIICFSMICCLFALGAKVASAAQPQAYIVQSGDSMWRIASKFQVGISEIIAANPQVSNPSLIYPGQKLTIPTLSDIKAIELRVVELVNVQRMRAGLPVVSNNWQLERVARYKSTDMAVKGYFSHTSPTYGSPFTMMQNFGLSFTAAGENIAMGQRTPEEVMNAWMNSPGHRANIMSPNFTQLGVGYAKNSSGTPYWTQMFIKP